MLKALMSISAAGMLLGSCGEQPASNVAADADNAAGAVVDKAQDSAGAMIGGATAPMVNTVDAYVAGAAIGDMYEIASSKLALEKSKSAEVRKFAQQMVTDHEATTAKLKAALTEAKLSITPPAKLDTRRQGMIDNLKAANAADFDTVYLDQQTAAHQEALTLQQSYAEDGENPVLKKLAGETVPKIQHHFEMVKQLDTKGADAGN
jgi:putative membrane protein